MHLIWNMCKMSFLRFTNDVCMWTGLSGEIHPFNSTIKMNLCKSVIGYTENGIEKFTLVCLIINTRN